jgi:hypothetical protein
VGALEAPGERSRYGATGRLCGVAPFPRGPEVGC